MELLYAGDLVLLADSMNELIEKVKRWRAGLEEKGLRINLCRTKIMKCCVESHQGEKSGKFPCGICGKGLVQIQSSVHCALHGFTKSVVVLRGDFRRWRIFSSVLSVQAVLPSPRLQRLRKQKLG